MSQLLCAAGLRSGAVLQRQRALHRPHEERGLFRGDGLRRVDPGSQKCGISLIFGATFVHFLYIFSHISHTFLYQAKTQLLQSILSFVMSPVVGRLSDSLGRRRLMIAAITPMWLTGM